MSRQLSFMSNKFFSSVRQKAELFASLDKPVKIVGHLDADGITATSILVDICQKMNKKFSFDIKPHLTPDYLNSIKEEIILFTDIGSSSIDMVENILNDKTVFIIDHHSSEKEGSITAHINPVFFGYDGSKEITGSGVAYFFAKELVPKPLAHIAVIGILGDVQEKPEMISLNKQILEQAVADHKIAIKEGINLFGLHSRNILKCLQFSTDLKIPGITNDRTACLNLLDSIKIPPYKKYFELTEMQKSKLYETISRLKQGNVCIKKYILVGEDIHSPLRDGKEFATVLNSCGRMGSPELGVDLCLGRSKEKILDQLASYKKEITHSFDWVKQNASSTIIQPNIYIINAKDKISPNIIGTILSMMSRSKMVKDNTFILGMARNHDNTTKVSLRYQGIPKHNLKEILASVVESVGGSCGGHSNAAGAIIDTKKEEDFIKKIIEEFKKVL